MSLALAVGFFTTEPPGNPDKHVTSFIIIIFKSYFYLCI